MTDQFKERLLVALKEEVAAREPARPVRSHRRKFMLAGALAAVAVAAGVVGVPSLTEDPAYAVDREPDGTIRIQLAWDLEPEDTERIEDRLEFFGVPSVVDLLGTGQDCARPRGVFVGGGADADGNIGGPDGLVIEESWWDEEAGLPHIDWRIDPDLIGDGQSLLVELHYERSGDAQLFYGSAWVMEGTADPCVIVPGGAFGE
ncbi:MAG TPA: hypothetical protein VGF17_31130 [Phytomonospora sp.]